MKLPLEPRSFALAAVAAGALALAPAATAQVSFSLDGHGPLIGVPDPFTGTPITEGDILTPTLAGPPGFNFPTLAAPIPPGISISGGVVPSPLGGLGLVGHAGCIGHTGGTPCPIEVDAISYGFDFPLQGGPSMPGTFRFSVDEYAVGFPVPAPPNVLTEGALGPEFEAASDLFLDHGFPPAPLPPFAGPPTNTGFIDGDGLPNTAGITYPGLGVVEPIPPGLPPQPGSNVDAFDQLEFPAAMPFPAYYSLDGVFPDPLTGYPGHGTAFFHGFASADVLVTPVAFGAPVIFAPGPLLGLDLAGGMHSDDLDALALWENGTGVFEPSLTPFDWTAGATDMLLFSVSRGSAVIGAPDSIFGIPIEEGDILTTPLPGGASPFPGIFIAAENLGIATFRSGMAAPFGDELDALDTTGTLLFDCNSNGTEDALDIVFGFSTDTNMDGIPDDCQLIKTDYCFCSAAPPCGNFDPNAGCANSTGVGALLSGTGTSSVANDDLTLTMSPLPTNKFGIFFMGTNQVFAPFGDGHRCVGGQIFRYRPPINSGATGSISLGPIVGFSIANFVPAGHIMAGSTWNFQGWYRDPMGPCGFAFNLTNASGISFTP